MALRPSFQSMWHHFSIIYGDGSIRSVGEKIGGKVKENIEIGFTSPKRGFRNACAIRMSYSLNYSGLSIFKGPWKTVSGADKKQYIFRVDDVKKFLDYMFEGADKTVKNPNPSDFFGLQGVLIFDSREWDSATGHATLWDGNTCSDHCYFPVATEASIWLLE